MTSINTNAMASIASNALTRNERAMGTAMERLSTGLRINSAKDDAAGLAIVSKMTSQIQGLNQAVRNANDGIALLQTVEGASVEITNMLTRMRELAVQSANDTNTSTERSNLDLEYQQLMEEITRVSGSVTWNGMKVMNNTEIGTSKTIGGQADAAREVKFQVGALADQTISVNLKDMSFDTGTAAVAGEYQLNMLAEDFSTATTLTFDITRGDGDDATVSFTVDISEGTPAEALATSEEVTAIAELIAAEINNRVGFQNVEVRAVGTSITIIDSEGGIVEEFDALGADAATVVENDATLEEVTAGVAAEGAEAESNTQAIFYGDARINNTSVTDRSAANDAIAKLDVAINNVNGQRAVLGSVMSRLEHAADNLANISTNTAASRGRILDADYAVETTELARTQIIAQAGTAMLAQANQSKQSVLALLK